MTNAVARITALDPSIFAVESQTSQKDRTALLRIHSLVRCLRGRYAYLEIGSHLGGTLVPHLLDPACVAIHSVDPRPQRQPDARGIEFEYMGNSTARMREVLGSAVPTGALLRLTTWEHDAADIPIYAYGRRFDLAFIDGQHTNIAAFSDFISILPALERDACVAFHDANLILDAIANVERLLRYERTLHATLFLPDNVAVVCLRGAAETALNELGPHALERVGYEAWARSALNEAIAANSAALVSGCGNPRKNGDETERGCRRSMINAVGGDGLSGKRR